MIRGLRPAVLAALIAVAPARADFDRAVGYFKGAKYVEAAAEFQSLVDRQPDYAYGRFMLGHCLLKMRRPADAEAWFRGALAADATRADFHYGLALALRAQGNLAAAADTLSRAASCARTPREKLAVFALRGRLLAALGRWPESALDLEVARGIRPEPDDLTLLGHAYFASGRPDLALGVLVDAVRRFPAEPEPYRLAGEALIRLGEAAVETERKDAFYGDALRLAVAYRRIRPDDPEAVGLLGRALLGARRFSDAEAALASYLGAVPGQCYAMVDLGRAYVGGGKWAPAEAVLLRAKQCAPKLAAVWQTLGAAYLYQQRPSDALAAFRQAEQLESSAAGRSGIEAAQRLLDGTAPVREVRTDKVNR